MKLSKKKFKVVESPKGFFIYEFLFILGFNISYTFYGLEGNVSDKPFKLKDQVDKKLLELEQLEEAEGPFRDGTVSLVLIILISVGLIIYSIL